MTFDKLQPGSVFYTVTRQRMGNTTISSVSVHPVRVLEVDSERRRVFASWNHNRPTWYSERNWKKWRVKKPVTVRCGLLGQMRLARRGEKA